MKGRIHYSKHGFVQVVGENSLVYNTGLLVSECNYVNRSTVEFRITDERLSRANIC